MESDKKLNPLAEFAKREDELSYFTKAEMIGLVIAILAIIGAIFYASITSYDEKTPAPIEAPMEHEPTQMEMNGWREPSAFDVIIHSDSGGQEPDT
jgi:5,10-methenyltetrahydromethanopterin hydrogenase